MSDSPPAHESRHTIARNARYGLWFFTVYVLFYAGFVAIAAFRFDLMGRDVAGGVNLAIAYGLGLIVLAFVLAMIYMVMVRAREGDSVEPAAPAEGRA